MLKKILKIAGGIFLGANLGVVSGFMPIYLLIFISVFSDGLNGYLLGTSSLITAVVTGIAAYIYSYRKKREQEKIPAPFMALVWSFCAGALIAAIALFTYASFEGYRIG